MRVLVVVLLAANALFFIWSRGWLDAVTGLPAEGLREPQRLTSQQHPERIQPLAASAVAALAQRSCLELGPLDGDAALAAVEDTRMTRLSDVSLLRWTHPLASSVLTNSPMDCAVMLARCARSAEDTGS